MSNIELSNPRCHVLLSPEKGGRIASFRGLGPTGAGVEHVGPNQLQLWLKTGEHHDPAAGMLHLFQGLLHRRDAVAKTSDTPAGTCCEFTIATDGVVFTKRFILDPTLPLLHVSASVTNTGAEPLNLQIEGSFNWNFGSASERKDVISTLVYPDRAERVYMPPYGNVCAETFDATDATLALSDRSNQETLLIATGKNWKRYTIYTMAGSSFRGPYSVEKKLATGETLEVDLRLALVAGAAAVDAFAGGQAMGLLPDKGVWFNDEPITASLALAQINAGRPQKTEATVTADGQRSQTLDLETNGTPYHGATRRVSFPAGTVRPGNAAIEAHFGNHSSRAPIRVLDAAGADEPLIRKSTKPAFPVRALHLIASQQGNRGLTVDAMKWLAENVVAPCGFTHVVWEFNNAMRLSSHPELAAEVSFSPEEIAGLAKFCRSLGVEPIPQQNLYGHQHETNLTRVYPELQEVSGELGVYCPTHPKTRAIVADIVRELLDTFESKLFHIGHDEIQFEGMPQRVGVCPRCRAQKPHEVFALDVNAINDVIRKAGGRSIMWGDHVIPPDCGGQNVNGLAGEVYRALDLLPRDLIIADWHYFPTENYKSTNFFLARGHDVWAGAWFFREGIRRYSEHAAMAHAPGMIYTTWCRPDIGSIPLEGMLYAAQCFNDLDAVHAPGAEERRLVAPHKLWRRWCKWNGK